MSDKMKKEYEFFMKYKSDNESGGPIDQNNMHVWKINFDGPKNSDYEGGRLHVKITFPPEYPNKIPVCYFLNDELLHPNIRKDGRVCFGKFQWNSDCTVLDLLDALMILLKYPNFGDGYDNKEVADFYKADPESYHTTVKQLVAEFSKY